MLQKVISPTEAAVMVPDGASVMFGGFMGCGNPHTIIDAMMLHGNKDMTLICNDGAIPDYGVGKLIGDRRFTKAIATHVGLNPAVAEQMNAGTLEVELIPQGTFAERIRTAGAGLGGFYTPTGVGTPVEDGKEVKMFNGKSYLLELPLFADVAMFRAHKADTMGNVVYRRSSRNFSPLMATAAKLVIVEVDEIVPVGSIDPDQVHTPAIFVDYLVQA